MESDINSGRRTLIYIFIITDRRVSSAPDLWLKMCLSHRMSISEGCDAEKISSLVKLHVPKVKLLHQHEAELTFMLPFENMDMLPGQIFVILCSIHGKAEESVCLLMLQGLRRRA